MASNFGVGAGEDPRRAEGKMVASQESFVNDDYEKLDDEEDPISPGVRDGFGPAHSRDFVRPPGEHACRTCTLDDQALPSTSRSSRLGVRAPLRRHSGAARLGAARPPLERRSGAGRSARGHRPGKNSPTAPTCGAGRGLRRRTGGGVAGRARSRRPRKIMRTT